MAFESLSDKLSAAFKKLRGKGRLTAADVKEAMKEVRMALLEADVSYKVVKEFTKALPSAPRARMCLKRSRLLSRSSK